MIQIEIGRCVARLFIKHFAGMDDITHYDIIGDIHGLFDKISAPMEQMAYARDGDGFVPPAGHKALFLGDLIDPKPATGWPVESAPPCWL